MVDIEKLKPLIVKRLLPLKPDKIILFGSFAYGVPNENSDIDIFLVKEGINAKNATKFELEAAKKLIDLQLKYKTNGIDIISASPIELENREDYFIKEELLKKGVVLYERNIG